MNIILKSFKTDNMTHHQPSVIQPIDVTVQLAWFKNQKQNKATTSSPLTLPVLAVLGIFKDGCGHGSACITSPWSCSPLRTTHFRLQFSPNPPHGLFSFFKQVENQNSRSWWESVSGHLKHISPSHFPRKDVSSRVLHLVFLREWHIRDSLHLIPSFMLCDRNPWACSPFTPHLSPFEIIVNVMLDLRWGLAASSNFTPSVIWVWGRERRLRHERLMPIPALFMAMLFYGAVNQRETSDICLSWKTVDALHPSVCGAAFML